jgi:phosphoribosylaminoimidazolecarboxamide formyltransferase/IMP cyclohydrolase
MNPIKRALISVSNKQGLDDFVKQLHALDVCLISTGQTAIFIKNLGIPVQEVSEITGWPEMMDGRVKTLHPKIHGGILGKRNHHEAVAQEYGIDWIDLVVVNLYPFEETIKKADVSFDEAIENIDIGGPTMIRSAAKNNESVAVIVDPADYESIMTTLQQGQGLSNSVRQSLAAKAFLHTSNYDAAIHQYFMKKTQDKSAPLDFPDEMTISLGKANDLRYGENPHQSAAAYRYKQAPAGVLNATQLQGKMLSFNNLLDADAALLAIRDFDLPTSVIIKHANLCGLASIEGSIAQAFSKAFATDPVSAFGGIIALNRPCDEETASLMVRSFFEVIIAPAFSEKALSILASKANLRLLVMDVTYVSNIQFQPIVGGFLLQERYNHVLQIKELTVVTECKPSTSTLKELLFAWQSVKHAKSNAILIAKQGCVVGIGSGQVSRVDAVEIALKKAEGRQQGAVLASDAFFPFRDSIDRIGKSGITAIIQPGGSVRDQEVIEACNEHGIAMILTGIRCLKH